MKLEAETKRGWHFTGDALRDDLPIPPISKWLRHEGEIVPCESGLHMSEHPWDSLAYAPGPILHRVELRGDLAPHGEPVNKWAGRERRIIASKDATDMLRRFAKEQALSVADKWDMPDVVREYLVSDSEDLRDAALNAARDAVRSAARDAARDSARDATWDAARDATRSMVLDAAWYAAWSAARDAARDAARTAARDAAWSSALNAARNAAWSAVRSSALDAALNAAKSDFANRVHEFFKEHAE